MHVRRIHGGLAPRFRASCVRADGKIAVQSDRKAAGAGVFACCTELQFRLPLQVLEILGAIGVEAIKLVVVDGRRRAIFGRPAPPATAIACGRRDVLVQRVEQPMQLERRPAFALKIAERAAALAWVRAELMLPEVIV